MEGKGRSMQDNTIVAFREALAMIAAGLGVSISFPTHAWVGGLMLGIGAAIYASRTDPDADRRVWWLVILGAALAAHVAGIFSFWWNPEFPPQVAMGIGGFASRYITRSALRFAGLVEDQAPDLAWQILSVFTKRYTDGTASKTTVTATGGPEGEATIATTSPNPPAPVATMMEDRT